MKMPVQELQHFLEKEKENLIAFLSDLIETKSLCGHEEEIVGRVRREFESCGYDEIITDSIGNVVGRIGNGKKIIVFDAHLDTVDADASAWETDPYSAVLKDGKLYGRGSVDDKGPFAAMLYAGKAVKELKLEHDFTIYIIGSVSEEDCDGLATGSFIEETGIRPDYAVIGEVSELEIIRGHRGRASIEVVFTGKPVHASLHHEGINPVELTAEFIAGLVELDKNLPAEKEFGRGDVAVTHIECKTASYNTIPASCTVILDRRTNSMDTRESILKELNQLPNADRAEVRIMEYSAPSYNGFQKKSEEYFPGWVLEEDHPFIQRAVKTFGTLFDRKPKVNIWPFCTNGTYTMGKAKIPTVGFGPGTENRCHGPDEYIEISELIDAVQFYAYLPVVLSE
jgi:putative selenium metabolism hydrolase